MDLPRLNKYHKQRIKCLAQGHNAVPQVRIKSEKILDRYYDEHKQKHLIESQPWRPKVSLKPAKYL